MKRRLRPPEWLLELEGVDGIAVITRPDGLMTVSQKFGNVEILLWGLADRETQPYIRPAAYEALKRPKVIERRAVLEAQRKKELERQEFECLSEEDKWLLRAQHMDQPNTGTGHRPGIAGGWLEDHAPTEFVQYLKELLARGGTVKLNLRWPIRFDDVIQKLAAKYSRGIPAGINFIKREGRIKAWGPSGYVTFDNPPDTPIGNKVKEIIAENLTDAEGKALKVVVKADRTTVVGVHLAYLLFFEEGLPIS